MRSQCRRPSAQRSDTRPRRSTSRRRGRSAPGTARTGSRNPTRRPYRPPSRRRCAARSRQSPSRRTARRARCTAEVAAEGAATPGDHRAVRLQREAVVLPAEIADTPERPFGTLHWPKSNVPPQPVATTVPSVFSARLCPKPAEIARTPESPPTSHSPTSNPPHPHATTVPSPFSARLYRAAAIRGHAGQIARDAALPVVEEAAPGDDGAVALQGEAVKVAGGDRGDVRRDRRHVALPVVQTTAATPGDHGPGRRRLRSADGKQEPRADENQDAQPESHPWLLQAVHVDLPSLVYPGRASRDRPG